MAEMVVRICDTCKSQEDVERYEVKEGSRRARIDLCREHSEPLEEVLRNSPSPLQGRKTTRSRPRQPTSMDEIEKLKKK